MTSSRSEAEHAEVFVQRSDVLDTKSAHDGKAGAIDDREILVSPGKPDFPGNFQIGRTDSFDHRDPASQAIPEALCCIARNSVMQQRPGFNQDMIRGHQPPV